MNIYRIPAFLLCASLAASTSLMADERVDHFKGLPAESLEVAVNNLTAYNQELQSLLAAELDQAALTRVHNVTYTLENALHKVQEEMQVLAETLEELHLASERYSAEAVSGHGQAYLEQAARVLPKPASE